MSRVPREVFFDEEDKVELASYRIGRENEVEDYICIEVGSYPENAKIFFDSLEHVWSFAQKLMVIRARIVTTEKEKENGTA